MLIHTILCLLLVSKIVPIHNMRCHQPHFLPCQAAVLTALIDVQVFTPLAEKCKRLNRAMRIGTNHGSLSARILSYYGDTPRGMVESAFEFANICRDIDYHNFLFSMKASNPLVMVQAYRLLAEEMYANAWDYPLHLGVTEVGPPPAVMLSLNLLHARAGTGTRTCISITARPLS